MRQAMSMGAILAVALFSFASFAAAEGPLMRGVHPPKDLPPSLRRSLADKVSDDAGPYLDREDEKKARGQPYTDLQQKFEYLPNWEPDGGLLVSVKIGGAEYGPKSAASSKGVATGGLRYLVFTYLRRDGRWVEFGRPKWETQNLGGAAAKRMTEHVSAADRRKAATPVTPTGQAAAGSVPNSKAAPAATVPERQGPAAGASAREREAGSPEPK